MKKKLKQRISKKNYLPHTFLAEKGVLSCLFINYESIEIVMQQLTVKMFYFKNHQEIFNATLFLYNQKVPFDIITLVTFLQDNGKLEKSGGIKVILELTNQIPNLTHLNYYIQLIKEKFVRRLVIKLGYKIFNSGYMMNLNLKTILINIEEELFSINSILQPSKRLNTNQLVYNVFQDLKKKRINKNSFNGIPSGFYALDSLIYGFQNSDLIIIAGRPSIGKTAFCLSLAFNIIKNTKLAVLFFSLEMGREQIIYRLLSMEANISQTKLKTGKLSKKNWSKLSKIFKILAKLPFFIDDNSTLTSELIRSLLQTNIFKQKKIGTVIIDYLQLMGNKKQNINNRAYELAQITRNLKNLAREFNIPIIVLSQLSRNVELRNDKKPILADLRESGSIEQDADLVLLLSRSKQKITTYNSNKNLLIDISIAKHRNGPTGTLLLQFDPKRTKFINY